MKVIICHFEANVFPRPVNLSEVEKSIIYPVSAVKNDIEALVFVKVLVGRDGSVKKKEFTGNEVFKNEVLEKIDNLRFTPAISATKPVDYYVTVPFRFELTDK